MIILISVVNGWILRKFVRNLKQIQKGNPYLIFGPEGTLRLTRSDWTGSVNIGSDEKVSISQLVAMIARIADKNIWTTYIPGPLCVRERNSDNNLIEKKLGWRTYGWIEQQVMCQRPGEAR